MSAYSLDYLRNHTLVGDTDQNGLPWTARAIGLGDDAPETSFNDEGNPWLYRGAVPLVAARELLSRFAVVSHTLAFVRPYRAGDEQNPNYVVRQLANGKPKMTIVTDESRQVIADDRTDRVHFVPKDGYRIHHSEETLIDRTARIVQDSSGDLHLDSVVVLAHGGEQVVSISTKKLVNLPEGVNFYPHILAAGSCNGTLSTTLAAVTTDVVCDNTRDMALGEGKSNGTMTKARHTRMSQDRLSKQESEARAALGLIETVTENFAAEVKELCATTVTDEQWSKFVVALSETTDESTKNALTRADTFRETATGLYVSDPRCAPWHGTAWGALQAINTMDLWERGTRGGTDHRTRTVREAITGKLAEREADRKATLVKVLAG